MDLMNPISMLFRGGSRRPSRDTGDGVVNLGLGGSRGGAMGGMDENTGRTMALIQALQMLESPQRSASPMGSIARALMPLALIPMLEKTYAAQGEAARAKEGRAERSTAAREAQVDISRKGEALREKEAAAKEKERAVMEKMTGLDKGELNVPPGGSVSVGGIRLSKPQETPEQKLERSKELEKYKSSLRPDKTADSAKKEQARLQALAVRIATSDISNNSPESRVMDEKGNFIRRKTVIERAGELMPLLSSLFGTSSGDVTATGQAPTATPKSFDLGDGFQLIPKQ